MNSCPDTNLFTINSHFGAALAAGQSRQNVETPGPRLSVGGACPFRARGSGAKKIFWASAPVDDGRDTATLETL
jgi:hypothetical protein